MEEPARNVGLRRGVLAVSVLDDISLVPTADGIRLEAGSGTSDTPPATVDVAWTELADAVDGVDPESDAGRWRLRDWLRFRALFAELGSAAAWRAEQAAVPMGLPVDHALHPGPGWAREHVLGGVLDLGIGVRGLIGGDPDHVAVLPDALARAIGLSTDGWWPALRARLEDMGELTVSRLNRDGIGLISPMGGCDAVTLIGARSLRRHLATADGTGLRAVAVPKRSRGWFDLARIDPAFVVAAAAATNDVERGFSRPLLVTCDEVGLATPGGDLTTIVLRDPATAEAAWPAY